MRTAVIAAARCHFLIRLKGEDAEMSNEKTVISLAVSIFLLIFFASVSAPVPVASANSQNSPAALTGIVSSEAEGPMEGVLVSAKPAGGSISITVVSDARGLYSFSADRLMPGRYRLAIRAIEYDAADPDIQVTVGKGKSEADIKLNRTRDLAAQLTDVEWLMSIPGTTEEKEHLFLTCSSCHTLGPVLESTYDVAGWMTTFERMRNWDQAGSIAKPMLSLDRATGVPFGNEEFAKYLSSLNLSSRSTHDFELKKLPRPHGDDTKVVITEYDLPRPGAEPHDVVTDHEGMVWYSDFAEGILGRLNPHTGEVKEWQDPSTKSGYPGGFQDLEWDREGVLWIARHDINGIAKFDKNTEKFINFSVPREYETPDTKTSFLAPTPSGKVWIKSNSIHEDLFRLDPLTGEISRFDEYPAQRVDKDDGGPRRHQIYGITVDSRGNLYEADWKGGTIVSLDGATGRALMHPTPTSGSGPRRMHIDSEDRLWIGEYNAQKIAMFNTKTAQFREWAVPVPWYGPYDVAPDKEGNVWTGTMSSDLILRLNPRTGEFRQYLMPSLGVNVRRTEVDNSGARPVFWVGENHRAKIAKVEPIE